MPISLIAGDFPLPLSKAFHQQLLDTFDNLSITPSMSRVTVNFRDPTYSAESGGFHPVEISLSRHGESWLLDYLTDFHYVGFPYPELEKAVDVSWQDGYCWLAGIGDCAISDFVDYWQLWQRNFVSYVQMGVFTLHISML